jgi:signal transduction histidine kinase
MWTSVRSVIISIYIFVFAIPTISIAWLIYRDVQTSKRLHFKSQQVIQQKVQDHLYSYLVNIKFSASNLIKSRSFVDFVKVQEEFSNYSSNLIYGKIKSLRKALNINSEWYLLASKTKIIFGDNEKLADQFSKFEDGFYLDNANEYLIYTTSILFDDQLLEGPSARNFGNLIILVRKSDFINKIDGLKNVYSLPINLDKDSLTAFEINNFNFENKTSMMSISSLLLIVGVTVFSFFLGFILIDRKIRNPIIKLTNSVMTMTGKEQVGKEKNEIVILKKMFESYLREKIKLQQQALDLKATEEMAKISSQVAHDIRSPLAALNAVASQLYALPEELRILVRSAIQRIEDITHDLSTKKYKEQETDFIDKEVSTQLISGLIEGLVSEKRIQFRDKQGLVIDASNSSEAYGLFAKINIVEFKRVLSNLINNSVEAMGNKGNIDVILRSFDGDVQVIVRDDGIGIPKDVLSKLTERGVSFGKEKFEKSGSGLGLFHAKETVEKWGGNLKIESEEGRGTDLLMILPKQLAPEWFLPEIKLTEGCEIVILDDDSSIHQVWQARFDNIGIDTEFVHHFNSPEPLKDWVEKNRMVSQSHHSNNILYLFDYELIGYSVTGLDMVSELGIRDNAVLVTSRYEVLDIKARCHQLNVKLLPKNLAGFVPIDIVDGNISLNKKKNIKSKDVYVLIDDDKFNHKNWKLIAKIYKKNISTFFSPQDFFQSVDDFGEATKIYIDSNLGNGIKGEDVARKIYDMGFKEIYLTTGYDKSEFPEMYWIKDVVNKTPPFVDC